MTRFTIAALALLITAPVVAYADTPNAVILTIENDAGMVTTVGGMTQRECNAAVALLSDRNASSSLTNGTNNVVIGGWTAPPAPHTPRLTSAKCVVPTKGN